MRRLALPEANFADLEDALFVALQYEAERISVFGLLAGRDGPRSARDERERVAAIDRAKSLVDLAAFLHALIPHEDKIRAFAEDLISGEARKGLAPGHL